MEHITKDQITERLYRVIDTPYLLDKDQTAEKLLTDRQDDQLDQVLEDGGHFMDSLDRIEMLMAVEEEFEIAISDGDGEKLQTFNQMVEYLYERQS